ncbi:hypothetical protein BKA93DRAFT_751642 [Sparassis latifolia]
MPASIFILFPSGITPATAKIGHLVANRWTPWESYISEDPSLLILANLIQVKSQTSVCSFVDSITKVEVHATFSKIFLAKYDNLFWAEFGHRSLIREAAKTALSGVTDVTLSSLNSRHNNSATWFISVGEMVFTVQYHQLKDYRKFLHGYNFTLAHLVCGECTTKTYVIQYLLVAKYSEVGIQDGDTVNKFRILIVNDADNNGMDAQIDNRASSKSTFAADNISCGKMYAVEWIDDTDSIENAFIEGDFMPDEKFLIEENGDET